MIFSKLILKDEIKRKFESAPVNMTKSRLKL